LLQKLSELTIIVNIILRLSVNSLHDYAKKPMSAISAAAVSGLRKHHSRPCLTGLGKTAANSTAVAVSAAANK
jgi:hypothetical protein